MAELPFNAAVTVTAWLVVTDEAVAVKVAVAEPAGMETEAGTVSAVLSSETTTEVLAAGAADNVTVQVEAPLDGTVDGEHCSCETASAGGVIVSEAAAEPPFNEAVMVAAWLVVTEPATAAKLAVVEPAATVTEGGTVRAALLSETATEVLAEAAADNVTVHVEVPPDVTVDGEHCSRETVAAGGVMVSDAVAETPLNEAVIVTGWLLVTDPAVAVKLALVEPAATVTEAGTVRAALLSEIATAELTEAAADNVTVHVEFPPETTVAGEHCNDCRVTAGCGIPEPSAGLIISL